MSINRINICPKVLKDFDEIIDVRSPAEYQEDHIPSSINLPVLNDKERALIGTIYKQKNKFEAKKLGAALISKNISLSIKKTLLTKTRDWKPLIYCWRGGQRSYALATILSQIGWDVGIIEGGYKSFRKVVTKFLDTEISTFKIILIAGNTGTAKTEMLKVLSQKEIQTVDLEQLANHKGSVFGSQGQKQPSQKRFETNLFSVFMENKKDAFIVMEAESNKIGNIFIPKGLWSLMKKAPQIELVASLKNRSLFLVNQYSEITKNQKLLKKQIKSLERISGSKKITEWLALADDKKFSLLGMSLMENHYDPRYKKSCLRNRRKIISSIELEDISNHKLEKGAEKIKFIISSL